MASASSRSSGGPVAEAVGPFAAGVGAGFEQVAEDGVEPGGGVGVPVAGAAGEPAGLGLEVV